MSPKSDAALIAAALLGTGALVGIGVQGAAGTASPAVTVTATHTARVTVTATVRSTERASRSHSRGPSPASLPTSRTTSEGARGGLPSGAVRGSELTNWQRRYWIAAQSWAQSSKARDVIDCESSNNPGAISATGKYRGLWQMDADFWRSYGGLDLASTPDRASRAEQNYVAYRGYVSRGWNPWECA